MTYNSSAQVQLQRLEQVQAERDELAARSGAAVTEARQAAGAQGLLAERRAGELRQALAQREAELEAALAAAGPAGAAGAQAAGRQCGEVSEAGRGSWHSCRPPSAGCLPRLHSRCSTGRLQL